MENTKSLSSALWQKLVSAVETSTPAQLGLALVLAVSAGILSWVVVDVSSAWITLMRLAHWHDSAPVKVAVVCTLVFNSPKIIRYAVHAASEVSLFVAHQESECDRIDGIPTAEILDHLFEHRTFLREEVKAKWGVAHHAADAICRRLEAVGILLRGECHRRELNPAYSRQDVASMLQGRKTAQEIEPLFRRDGKGMTARPTAEAIRQRVSASLSPAPGFRFRKVADGSPTIAEQAPYIRPTTDRTTVSATLAA